MSGPAAHRLNSAVGPDRDSLGGLPEGGGSLGDSFRGQFPLKFSSPVTTASMEYLKPGATS